MEKNNKRGIILGILIAVIVIVGIYCILCTTKVINFSILNLSSNKNGGNELRGSVDGTYKWSKSYTNEYGNNINLNVILVLNTDGTAAYEASDGSAYEATIGTYKLENGKIIYTREYYNYPNQEKNIFSDDANKTVTFDVIDKNTLQNTFSNQVTELKRQEKITKDMLVGTYTWSKNYTNEYGSDMKLKVTLVLNKDGSATYNASDGYAAEATKGTYKLEYNRIIYTREYYNYPNQDAAVFDDYDHKTVTFDIIDKNTLQNTFNDQTTELKKRENITKDMLVGTYTWSKNYTNEYGSDMKLKVTLVLNKDGSATYNASDGYAAEATKGTYKLENYQIIYTREYYNYPNQENSRFNDSDHNTEIFEIIDKSTLQNTFNNQTTELKK